MKIQHALVTLDHSELAEAALNYAIDLVEHHGTLTLLTVVESSRYARREGYHGPTVETADITLATGMMSYVTTEYEQQAWEQAEQYLDRVAARIKTPGLGIDKQIRGGNPAERILKVARQRNVDAIVMSTHGRSGLSRWVMGSVAQKVLCAATCPVFLVPQRSLQRVTG